MEIKIGFSTTKSKFKIGANLIRWWIGAPFSHTYMEFKVPDIDECLILQAVGHGVEIRTKNNFLKENEIIQEFLVNITEEKYLFILNKSFDHLGDKYGFLQNIGDVIAKIFKLKNNPINDGINCSELMAEIIIEIDPEAFSEIEDLNLVTPKDIFNYLNRKKYGTR